jgi:hypothetical protein
MFTISGHPTLPANPPILGESDSVGVKKLGIQLLSPELIWKFETLCGKLTCWTLPDYPEWLYILDFAQVFYANLLE